MGCAILCKTNKENEVIKSEVKKEVLENDQPIIENIEKVETQKNIIKDKKLETNEEQKKIILSVNKGNISENNNNLLLTFLKLMKVMLT